MSWFTLAFSKVLPFVTDVFETRDVKQSGNKLFEGLAKSLKDAASDPDKVREIAEMLEAKKGELTGAVLARTPAAGLVDPEFMPPGSVDPTQEVVEIPSSTTAEAPDPAATENPPETDYVYDDTDDEDDDEPEDEQEAPKAKAKKKKKK